MTNVSNVDRKKKKKKLQFQLFTSEGPTNQAKNKVVKTAKYSLESLDGGSSVKKRATFTEQIKEIFYCIFCNLIMGISIFV